MHPVETQRAAQTNATGFVRAGLALAAWAEKWFPDPVVFALSAVVAVFVLGICVGESPTQLAISGGKSFWALMTFTMQMVMVIIGGYVVASTRVVSRAIHTLARVPKTPRGAIAWVAFFSMATAFVSWGMSLIFSGLLVRQVARRMPGMDYRAAGAAAYLGIGTTAAMGLTSSAGMLMATKSSLPSALYSISGLIPLTQTIFLWQSLATVLAMVVAGVLVAYLSAPSAEHAKTVDQYNLALDDDTLPEIETRSKRPGEYLERSPLLTILVAAIVIFYLIDEFRTSPRGPLAALDLNTYNLIFLTLGLLLHWRPRNFMRAVTECIPATAGVVIQFPLCAMILGMITGTGLSAKAANLFVSVSSHQTFAVLIAAYSAVLGMFIPSAGSKWIVEAPYVLQAAMAHQVHLGWVVQIYNAAEGLPNLINPFWMLPLIGILRLRARDLVGYGMLQLSVLVPVVFLLCWLFSQQLLFIAPVK